MLRRPDIRHHNVHSESRRGTATVELALVLNFMIIPMLIGLWEMGRFVQVQQIISNSAREGARMAAQAVTITPSGSPIQISTNAPAGTPCIKSAVMQYLSGNGLRNLTYADVDVSFQFLPTQPSDPALVLPVPNPYPTPTEPFHGVQNQRFRVTVTITDWYGPTNQKPVGSRPLTEKTLWPILGFVQPRSVSYQVDWVVLVDRPFAVNTTVPTW
jgi:hypothetical protein